MPFLSQYSHIINHNLSIISIISFLISLPYKGHFQGHMQNCKKHILMKISCHILIMILIKQMIRATYLNLTKIDLFFSHFQRLEQNQGQVLKQISSLKRSTWYQLEPQPPTAVASLPIGVLHVKTAGKINYPWY